MQKRVWTHQNTGDARCLKLFYAFVYNKRFIAKDYMLLDKIQTLFCSIASEKKKKKQDAALTTFKLTVRYSHVNQHVG